MGDSRISNTCTSPSIMDIVPAPSSAPDADEQFCLKWNDFSANMAQNFKSLRDEKAFCDVTISVEGQQLQAHKMIISACSPFFKKMIEMNNNKHPLIVLRNIPFLHMSAILEFMYHGEVSVTQEELPAFLKTAEKLEIKGLAEDEKEGGEMSEVVEEISTAELEEAEPKFLM